MFWFLFFITYWIVAIVLAVLLLCKLAVVPVAPLGIHPLHYPGYVTNKGVTTFPIWAMPVSFSTSGNIGGIITYRYFNSLYSPWMTSALIRSGYGGFVGWMMSKMPFEWLAQSVTLAAFISIVIFVVVFCVIRLIMIMFRRMLPKLSLFTDSTPREGQMSITLSIIIFALIIVLLPFFL